MDAKQIAYRAIEQGAMQKQAELEDLLAVLIARPPQKVLELGCFMGGTLFAWRELGAEVLGVDQAVHERFNGHGARIYIGDSHSPSTYLEVSELMDDVDFLFIDGDHRYEGVKRDFYWYRRLVRPGGLIAFHDIAVTAQPETEVWRLWRELRSARVHEWLRSPIGWGGIGLLEA